MGPHSTADCVCAWCSWQCKNECALPSRRDAYAPGGVKLEAHATAVVCVLVWLLTAGITAIRSLIDADSISERLFDG